MIHVSHNNPTPGRDKRRQLFVRLVLTVALLISVPSWASSISVQEQVASAMSAYLDAQRTTGQGDVSFRAGRLDPRLRLTVCDQPLEINEGRPLNVNRGRQTVKVSCHGTSPWRIFVPVELTRRESAVVVTRPLAAGDVITASDLTLSTVDANRARGAYYQDASRLVGMAVTRPLQSGELVTQRAVGVNAVVTRGDIVAIRSGGGGLVVGSTGEVQGRAGVGQRVRVKNTSSGQEIETIVIDNRTVEAIGG